MFLQHVLTQLTDKGDHIELQFSNNDGNNNKIKSRRATMMLPPRLIAQNIQFTPTLKLDFIKLMQQTPTWMASHAKVAFIYAEPFWRHQGLSGSAYAQYPNAVPAEIFDVSSDDTKFFGLSGFFALPAGSRQKYRDNLEALVLQHMLHLFGPEAATPIEIKIFDWSNEEFSASQLDQQPLNEHPSFGHQDFQLGHWNDKLFFGGTETAQAFGGYLEGALQSAKNVAQNFLPN